MVNSIEFWRFSTHRTSEAAKLPNRGPLGFIGDDGAAPQIGGEGAVQHVERELRLRLEGDLVRDPSFHAAIARRLGCTPARITHLLDLTLLAPAIQEHLLALEAVDGREPTTERALRRLTRAASWQDQWAAWCKLGLMPPTASS